MRYLLISFAILVVLVLAIAGFRGGMTRRPPIELFADMVRQAKVRPEAANNFFADDRGSRLRPEGTVARGDAYQDIPVHTGRVTGATNFVETMPVPVTEALMARGQERFTVNCSPCHGPLADGNGITKKISAMGVVANLHDKRIVTMPDGELFNTLSYGKNLMPAYAAQIPIEDRWAILAYLRALQLSALGSVDEVPQDLRAKFK